MHPGKMHLSSFDGPIMFLLLVQERRQMPLVILSAYKSESLELWTYSRMSAFSVSDVDYISISLFVNVFLTPHIMFKLQKRLSYLG